jgi:hypothetical protein
MADITNTASMMTVTLNDGRSAKRATRNLYAAAIVGMKGSKLCVISAHYEVERARETMAAAQAGKFISHKFYGATELQIVTADAGFEPEDDPDAWKVRDDALIAAHRAA